MGAAQGMRQAAHRHGNGDELPFVVLYHRHHTEVDERDILLEIVHRLLLIEAREAEERRICLVEQVEDTLAITPFEDLFRCELTNVKPEKFLRVSPHVHI